MQKLSRRNTYTPYSASLAVCSVTHELNREETLSALSLKTLDNNPEVNLAQHTERSIKPLVYVISTCGKQLMSCSFAKSKRLVKKGAAKVVKRVPFTIQLIRSIDPVLWIHRHTHTSFDYMIKNTRVICNPRGYCGYSINPDFNPTLTVQI